MKLRAPLLLVAAFCSGVAACCCGLPTSSSRTSTGPVETPTPPTFPTAPPPPGFHTVGAPGWTMAIPTLWQQRPPPAGPRPGSNYELHAADATPRAGFVANVMVMHRNDPMHGIVVARSGPATAGMFAQQGTTVTHHGPTRLGWLEAYEIETATSANGTDIGTLMTLAVNGPHYFTITCSGARAAWPELRATCVAMQQTFRAQ